MITCYVCNQYCFNKNFNWETFAKKTGFLIFVSMFDYIDARTI